MLFSSFFTVGHAEDEPYQEINKKEILSVLITRQKADRVYSGQIKSSKGAQAFLEKYSVKLDVQKIDFQNQMVIFGITDQITTRAYRFLKRKDQPLFILDYLDSGIRIKIGFPGEGKKYSHIQLFLIDKIEGIPHIKVRNFVKGKLSKIYE
jgi:hypothetical protein